MRKETADKHHNGKRDKDDDDVMSIFSGRRRKCIRIRKTTYLVRLELIGKLHMREIIIIIILYSFLYLFLLF
jgi:hypothetical protein